MPNPARPQVAVVGLGRMGAAMASSMQAAGLEVTGYDIDAQKAALFARPGAVPVRSPREAAQNAAIVVVVVHDEAQVEEVLAGPEGAMPAMSRGAVVWLASTVSPSYAKKLGERLAACGLMLLDAPVSGGTTGASAGELTAIAGGSAQALTAAEPALVVCTRRVYHVGPAGAGSAVKMVNQLMVAVHSMLTGEAMALAVGAGLDAAKVIEVVTHSAGSSVIFAKRAPRIAAGEHEVQVSIATLRKDLAIAVGAARDFGLLLPLAERALQVLEDAIANGRGTLSDTRLVECPTFAPSTSERGSNTSSTE